MSVWGRIRNISTVNGNISWSNQSAEQENETMVSGPHVGVNHEDDLAATVVAWMEVYITPALLFIAVFGNLTSFAVFSTPPYRQSLTAVLYRVLAVVDTMVVVIFDGLETLALLVSGVSLLTYNTVTCKLLVPLHIWSRAFSSWVLVIISLERFIGILFPHRAKVLNTKRRFGWLTFTIAMSLLAFYSPLFVTIGWTSLDVQGVRSGAICGLNIDRNRFQEYFSILGWATPFLSCLIPFAFIITFNVSIVCALIKRRKQIHGNHDSATKNSGTIAILIAVSITFIILTLPYSLYLLLQVYFKQIQDYVSYEKTFILLKYANICDTANHSINIVLYCLCGRKFRQCLREMLCCVYIRGRSNVSRSNNTAKNACQNPCCLTNIF